MILATSVRPTKSRGCLEQARARNRTFHVGQCAAQYGPRARGFASELQRQSARLTDTNQGVVATRITLACQITSDERPAASRVHGVLVQKYGLALRNQTARTGPGY